MLRRFHTLFTIGSLGFAAQLAAQVQPAATPDDFTQAAPHEPVWSTFDPNGPFDNDTIVKDPFGGATDESVDADDFDVIEPPDSGGDERGGPPNDACGSATVIPGNVVTYNPAVYSTVSATEQFCELSESCEVGGSGSSNSVWYRYTPDKDGFIIADTHGSNYNTVLSIWNGCPGGIPPNCASRTQYVCNDDFLIAETSEVGLRVTAGVTYYIKVADFNNTSGGGFLNFNMHYYPPNDLCADATAVTGIAFSDTLSTQNADTEACEEGESCELNGVGVSNCVWYKYTPPCNGAINLNTNGSNYDTVLSIWDGCGEWVSVDWPCIHANELACDDDSGTGTNSQILNFPVTEGTDYIIKISDYNGAQGGGSLIFNLVFSGAGTPSAAITAPAAFGNACGGGNVPVTGSASAGSDLLLGWDLDYKSGTGTIWFPISSGTTAVNNATLGNWNTASLGAGYYVLRLTVVNGCGVANSAVQVVYLDQTFESLDLRSPQNGQLLGGLVCFDGTVWDQTFQSYTLHYRALPGGVFAPINPGSPTYTTATINDPLAPGGWNTNGLPDGSYELRLQGTDICGHTATITRTVTLDNTPPSGVITSPLNCDDVSGVVQITGTASDTNLAGWALQYTGGQINSWSTIASGNTPVVNGLLGTLDTSRLTSNCAYTLRLLVSDQSVVNCGPSTHQAEYTASVTFGGGGNPCPADVNGDGVIDINDLAIILSQFGMICP